MDAVGNIQNEWFPVANCGDLQPQISGGGSGLGGEGQLLTGSWSFDSVTSGAGAEEIESVCLNLESGFASCSSQGPIEAGLGWCVE